MNEFSDFEEDEAYVPDKRFSAAYSEANELNEEGCEALCPSYLELLAVTNRYRERELIGRGALKEVYRVYDAHTQRQVALAKLRSDRGVDFYDLFVHESWLVASLNHPNIIKVHDTGVCADGRPFFTMDLESNTTLADHGARNLNESLQTFLKVCNAMAYAHSSGVLHLDLKPENIQDDVYGEVLVCDWGLGKEIEGHGFEEDVQSCPVRSLDNMTLMGQIKGSLGYMAPEQVVPGSPKDHRTDIYALGCMLHFILTGEPPFSGTREEVLAATEESKVCSPRLTFPDLYIPESLDAVVMKATSLAPENRYQSVERLSHEIESYLAGFSTRAEQSGYFREAKLFIARNRLPVFITALALLGFGVIGSVSVQNLARQKKVTAAERERADHLSEEVVTRDSEHASYVIEIEEEKRALAQSLAEAAKVLKTLSIYKTPVTTVKRIRQVVITALQQDPNCADAHGQHFALDCVQLNYRVALSRSPLIESTRPYASYEKIVRAFPDFSFNDKRRPTLEELVAFLREVRLVDDTQAARLERALAYDFDARADKTGYVSIVEAFLQYRYGGPEHLSLQYDTARSALSLRADGDLSLTASYNSEPSVLRFLTFRYLELDVAGRVQIAELDGLPIESLDLSRCLDARLKGGVNLPQLKKVIIRPGQFRSKYLKNRIQSNEPFEIVEAPNIPRAPIGD